MILYALVFLMYILTIIEIELVTFFSFIITFILELFFLDVEKVRIRYMYFVLNMQKNIHVKYKGNWL